MEFAFPTIVQDLSAVPEDFRPFYATGDDGKFSLRDDPGVAAAVRVISGQNKAIKSVREEVAGLKKSRVDLSPLAEFGDNPAAILENVNKRISEFQAELSKGDKAKLDLEKVRADMTKGFESEKKKYETRIGGLTTQLTKIMVTDNARAAILEEGGDELLLPFVVQQLAAVEEDGEFRVHVVDGQGNQRGGGTGLGMTIRELVKEMKSNEKYAKLFKSETESGGGASSSSKTNRLPTGVVPSDKLTANEKIAAGLNRKTRR